MKILPSFFLISFLLHCGTTCADIDSAIEENNEAEFAAIVAQQSGPGLRSSICSTVFYHRLNLLRLIPLENIDLNEACYDRRFDELRLNNMPAPFMAAALAQRDQIDYFVDHGFDINTAIKNQTMLTAAARYGHLALVKALISEGAQPLLVDEEEYLVADALRAASAGGHIDIVRWLVSQGESVNPGYNQPSPLMAAVRSQDGSPEMVRFLLAEGADKFFQPQEGMHVLTAFAETVYLRAGVFNPYSYTREFTEEIARLLDLASFPQKMIEDGIRTAIYEESAINSFHFYPNEMVKLIVTQSGISLGAQLSTPEGAYASDAEKETVGKWAVGWAASKEAFAAMDWLLAEGAGFTRSVLIDAIKENNTAIALRLIADGVPTGFFELEGEYPLLEAADNGNTTVLKALIYAGADLDRRDTVHFTRKDKSAFDIAASKAEGFVKPSVSGENVWEQMWLRDYLETSRDFIGCLHALARAGATLPTTAVSNLPPSFDDALQDMYQLLRTRDYSGFMDQYLPLDTREDWFRYAGVTSQDQFEQSSAFDENFKFYLASMQNQLQQIQQTRDLWASGVRSDSLPGVLIKSNDKAVRLWEAEPGLPVDGLGFLFEEQYPMIIEFAGASYTLMFPTMEHMTSRPYLPQEHPEGEEHFQSLQMWSSILRNADYNAEAARLMKEVVAAASGLKPIELGILITKLASIEFLSGDIDKGMENARISHDLTMREKEDHFINYGATELLMLGSSMTGDMDDSARYADELIAQLDDAMKFMEEFDDRAQRSLFMSKLVHSYANLGGILTRLEQYDRARQLLENIREKAFQNEGVTESTTIQLSMMLGELYMLTGQAESALSIFQSVIEDLEKSASGYSGQMVFALDNIGSLYMQMGEFQQAQEYIGKATDIARKIWRSDDPQFGMQLFQAGNVALTTGDKPGAQAYFKEADVIFARTNSPSRMFSLVGLGQGQIETAPENALALIDEALELAKENFGEDSSSATVVLSTKAGALELIGEDQKAIDLWEEVLSRSETQRNQFHNEYDRRSYLTQIGGYYDLLANLYLKQNDFQNALQTIERQKSKSLLELMANKNITSSDLEVSKVLRQLDSLDRNIAGLTQNATTDFNRGFSVPEIKVPGSAQESARIRLESDRHARLQQLRQLNLAYSQLKSVDSINLVAFQEKIPADTAFVILHEGPGLKDPMTPTLKVFILTSTEISSNEVAVADLPLEALLKQLREGTDISALLANSQNIYGKLLAPLANSFNGFEKLVLVADGQWNFLPFAVLHDGSSYLVDQHVIVNAPSLSIYDLLMSKPPSSARSLLAFGDPISPLGPLAGAQQEVKVISSMFSESDVAIGSEASESRLKAIETAPGTLHIASHGVFNLEGPERSYLSLTADDQNDGYLEVHEAYNLNLDHTGLVVLSACESGVGSVSGGDVVSLVRPFFYSGAKNVVASLWQVDDTGTMELMSEFYRQYLADDHDSSKALRSAQQALKSTGEFSHPYYWAAFQSYGASQEAR